MPINYRLIITSDTELYTPVDPRLHRLSSISPMLRGKQKDSLKSKWWFWVRIVLFAMTGGAGLFFRREIEELLQPVSNFIAVSIGI